MTAVLTDAQKGESNTTALSGSHTAVASGDFVEGATLTLEIQGDSLPYTAIHTFSQGGAVEIAGKTGHNLRATVNGGNGVEESINLSVL